jgi:hypothetical protein
MSLHLPSHIIGARPSGALDSLRLVPPTAVAPGLSGSATSIALGAHVARISSKLQAVQAEVDGTAVLFLTDRDGRRVHVIVDTSTGPAEVVGWSAEQIDEIRTTHFGGLGVGTAKAPAAGTAVQLSAAIDPMLDNTFHATRAAAGTDREVDRLVALADTLDASASSGDAEVDRLVKLADGLSDG